MIQLQWVYIKITKAYITWILAPTASAKSTLFMTNKSLSVMPGPPLRGILSPPITMLIS